MVSLGVEDQDEEDEEEEEEEDIEVHASPELGSWTLKTRVQDERYVPPKCDTSITCVPVFSSEMVLYFCFYHNLYHVHSFSRNYPLISRNDPCCTCCIRAAFFA